MEANKSCFRGAIWSYFIRFYNSFGKDILKLYFPNKTIIIFDRFILSITKINWLITKINWLVHRVDWDFCLKLLKLLKPYLQKFLNLFTSYNVNNFYGIIIFFADLFCYKILMTELVKFIQGAHIYLYSDIYFLVIILLIYIVLTYILIKKYPNLLILLVLFKLAILGYIIYNEYSSYITTLSKSLNRVFMSGNNTSGGNTSGGREDKPSGGNFSGGGPSGGSQPGGGGNPKRPRSPNSWQPSSTLGKRKRDEFESDVKNSSDLNKREIKKARSNRFKPTDKEEDKSIHEISTDSDTDNNPNDAVYPYIPGYDPDDGNTPMDTDLIANNYTSYEHYQSIVRLVNRLNQEENNQDNNNNGDDNNSSEESSSGEEIDSDVDPEDCCGCTHTGQDQSNTRCLHHFVSPLSQEDAEEFKCCYCEDINPQKSCDHPGCSCIFHTDCWDTDARVVLRPGARRVNPQTNDNNPQTNDNNR